MMDNSVKKTENLDWVDALKGIAIVGVVAIHAGGSHLPGAAGKIGTAGLFGVQMFFMISAFLTWKSLENGSYRYRDWIKKKFFRLMPEYYCAYLLALIVVGFQSIPCFIVHLSGLWGLVPQYNNTIMAEWYLGALIIFYLVAPFFHKIIDSLGKASVAFFVAVIISSIVVFGAAKLFPVWMEDYRFVAYMGNTSVWVQLPSLALGVVLYYLILFLNKKHINWGYKSNEYTLIAFSIFLFSCVFLIGEIFGVTKIAGFNKYVRFTFGFMGLAVSQHISKCSLLVNDFLKYLGKRSYSIYLFHYSIINIINKLLNIEDSVMAFGVSFFSAMIGAIILGIVYSKLSGIFISKFRGLLKCAE